MAKTHNNPLAYVAATPDGMVTHVARTSDRVAAARKRLLFASPVLLACIALGVTLAPLVVLYNTAYDQQESRLVEAVHSMALMVEAVGSHNDWDAEHTLKQVRHAQRDYMGIGETGEFTLARRSGDEIQYLLRHRHGDYSDPLPAAFHGTVAEPMRRALSGRSGTVVGPDYRGETVLAAHEPMQGLDWGIVAKMDLSEIRAPFVLAAPAMLGISALLVSAGSLLILQAGKRAIADMEEREARTRAIVETAVDGIITTDDKGIIESFNNSAAKMFGYAQTEVVGRHVSILMPPGHVERYHDYLANYLRSGEAKIIGAGEELEGRRKDGTTFPLHLSVSEVKTKARHLYAGIARDLTEARALEGQARKLASIGKLAAGIAHEINTPTQFVGDNTRFLRDAFSDLRIVLNTFEELLQAASDDGFKDEIVATVKAALEEADVEYLREEIPKAINQSLDGVNRIATMVRAMKEFSHPASTERTLTDVSKVIDTTVTVARNEWKYVADVVTELDPQLPEVPCHADEIGQVVLNLIVNAAHAIAERYGNSIAKEGKITIATRRWERHAEIRVTDNGTGIPEEVKSKVFEPFFTTKGRGQGTGQGLAVVHRVVVTRHGGSIQLESEVGSGTTIKVWLPLTATSEETQENGKEEASLICR